MDSFEGIRRPSYSTERFARHPEVIATRALIDEGLERFAHDLHEQISPGIDQAILFEISSAGPVTPFHNPRLHEVGGAIAGAQVGERGNFLTFNEVIGAAIPLRGTALEAQFSRAKKAAGTMSSLTAPSALNTEHTVFGFPVKDGAEQVIGMTQVAVSHEVARHLVEYAGFSTNYTQLTRAQILWKSYAELIGEQITELHALHKQQPHNEPYFESLELDSPKVAPNSIALTFDLANSTERALAQHDGAFTHFLNTWKRNVARLMEFHELSKTAELIGDLGDGYSVIFWLGKDTDIYDEQAVEAYRDLVVEPFAKNVQAMTAELAARYANDLGLLTFNSTTTETFSRIISPNDISARGLWQNAKKLKQ